MAAQSAMVNHLARIFFLFTAIVKAFNYSTVAEHCASLYNYTLDPGFEAPTVVTNVTLIPAHSGIPAYCRVEAKVALYTGILVLLPAAGKDWDGHYTAEGCGGSCGSYAYMEQVAGLGSGLLGEDVVKRGWVSSGTDMGHENTPEQNTNSEDMFRNNRTTLINWSYLSTHYLAVTGQAMTEQYYGKPPTYSYFRGGSTGGRQGMIEAQRYPNDFDAIIMGYAAFNKTGIPCTQDAYLGKASLYPNGTSILANDDIYTLVEGSLTACDANDGLVDGIIDPSYKCSWDPISVYCPVGKTASGKCLSNMAKVTMARTLYNYAYDSAGHLVYKAKFYPGSECEWESFTSGGAASLSLANNLALCFQVSPPLNFTLDDWNLDVQPYQMGYMGDIMNPQSYDLSVFSNKGGKIIHYQGMSDGLISMDWNLNYYKGMIEANGGYDATQSWYRFFYYPGMGHVDMSHNSTIAWRTDYYTYLQEWYENAKAPESVEIERVVVANQTSLGKRLYFPWPLVQKYVGKNYTGTTEDLVNWVGVRVPDWNQTEGITTYDISL